MTIGNGAKLEGNGILTKERPRFCRESDVWLPRLPEYSTQFHYVNLEGVKRNMVLFFKESKATPSANIVGVDCFEDGILAIKRINPTNIGWSALDIGLTVLAL